MMMVRSKLLLARTSMSHWNLSKMVFVTQRYRPFQKHWYDTARERGARSGEGDSLY